MTLTKAGTQHLNAFNNSILKTQKSLKKTNVNGLNLTTKPDSFEKKLFNVDSAIESLRKLKDSKDKDSSKFKNRQLMILKKVLKTAPEKWNDVNALANKKHLSGKFITKVATKNEADRLHQIRVYADAKTTNQYPKYTEEELLNVHGSEEFTTEVLKKVAPLTSTMMNLENILEIGIIPEEEIPPVSAILAKVTNLEKACKGECVISSFGLEPCSNEKSYIISAEQEDTTVKSVLTDKKLNTLALEEKSYYSSESGKTYQIKKVNDLRTNTTAKVRSEINTVVLPEEGMIEELFVTHEIRMHKDKNGKTIKIEYTQPSEIPGVFNIKHEYPNGKVEVVSEGTINKKTGTQSVIKNMTSLDGTKTEYKYEDTPDGDRIMDYKITDKNGKVLLKKGTTFEVVDKNKFISSKNDDKYEITVDKKGVHVRGITHPDRKADFELGKEILGHKKKLLTSLKQMPGEELIKLSKSTKFLVGINNNSDAFYMPLNKSISTGDDLFTILHELGHAFDWKDVKFRDGEVTKKTAHTTINIDEKFNKIYQEEKNAFNKEFPAAQREHIEYFINDLTHINEETGGREETIAESNALLTTCKTDKELAIRTQYLQQYFPKTIVYLSTKLDG